jgi:hypothetical protein
MATSKAKAEANRRNAARSTGPRTAEGKSRSAQNARRHGFASALIVDAMASKKTERLARAIAGTNPDPHRLYYARVIAEMQFTLALIAEAKIALIKLTNYRLPATRCNPEQRISAVVLKCLERLRRLERYEQRAFSLCSRAVQLINS